MYVLVSAGNCRLACAAAIKSIGDKIAEDREAIRQKSYDALYNGAVHNGLKPTAGDLAKMNEMVDNDLEHMMSSHPGQEHLDHCKTMLAMLDHTSDTEVAIDDVDFRVLRTHLDALRETSAAA